MRMRTFPIFLVFLVMGFGDAVGPFTSLAKQQFHLSSFQANLIAFTGFLMFGLLSVPMGLVQDRIGKKSVLSIGLVLATIGMLIPTLGGFSSYAIFLITIFLVGAGASILQVSGNPIMRDVSPEGKYSRNLSLAQFIKAIGSLSASLIPIVAFAWFQKDWKVCFPIYSGILLITVLVVAMMHVKEVKDPKSKPASLASCLGLLNNGFIFSMVLAIFLYVGAEVCVSANVATFLSERFQVDLKTWGLFGNMFFFLFILTGRFIGSVVLNWMKPGQFLRLTCVLALAGLAMLPIPNPIAGYAAFGLIGLGFANIFPLIFSITIDRMPQRSNEISSLMVTAIVGGAFVPPLMGLLADHTTLLMGFAVPALCVVYITYLALTAKKKTLAKA